MEKTKILILEANPHEDLDLNDEMRDVQNVIRQSQAREEFEIAFAPSVKSTDLQDLMSDHKPNMVHFCGHGAGQDGLVFRDRKIDAGKLSHIFEYCQHYLQCMVLNACYSEVQANEIVKYIPYVIGINNTIADKDAIAFSMGFYSALGYGRSFQYAYRCGCKAIENLKNSNSFLNRDAIAEERIRLAPIEEIRKFVPINDFSEAIIIPEHLKPVFKKKQFIHKDESEMLEEHYNSLIKAIKRNKVVFFLGSDINLCDRIQADGKLVEPWEVDCPYPPSGKELAAYLARTFPSKIKLVSCPVCKLINSQYTGNKLLEVPAECPLLNDDIHEHAVLICPRLQYLSQYAELIDPNKLDEQLKKLRLGCQPNQLHKFLVTLTRIMEEKGYYPPYPLIVTTNYDRALEKAFEDAEEEFDLVFYSNAINTQIQDKFLHQKPNDNPKEITAPVNEYKELSFAQRPVILKLYGSLDRIEKEETLVITEENYIEYLVTRNLNKLLPPKLLTKLRGKGKNILFLGYPLGNWNQRIILHRIYSHQLTSAKPEGSEWWTIQPNPEPLAGKLWNSYDVALYDIPLRDYVIELEQRVRDIPAKGRR
ncbi:MAG: SIR2 family protein [Xenococcaceae cyanobacterium]